MPPAFRPEETVSLGGEDPYAAAADSWAAGQPEAVELADDEAAARRLYDLALEFQERSQRTESRLLDEFETRGHDRIEPHRRPDDRRRRRRAPDADRGRRRSAPRSCPRKPRATWRTLSGPDELVEFYDPTDVFGDLADALADAYPAVAPEMAAAGSDIDDESAPDEEAEAEAEEEAETGDAEAVAEADTEAATDEGDDGAEGRPTA